MNNIKFYKNRVTLNVLVGNLKNAVDCYNAADGYIVLGLLSKKYKDDISALNEMEKYSTEVNSAISIGLGGGDPEQSHMVSRLTKVLKPQHSNQVFTGVGITRGGCSSVFINCLVSPTGKAGYVNIATGPLSSKEEPAIVSIETAISMAKDMGGNSLKYFPINGLQYKEEYISVANACSKSNFGLEPTGGIDLENFEEILKIALDAGVPKIIPHIYSSIIDKETGNTRVEDVVKLFEIVKALL
ncbi:MAG: KDGP aldolase family protein [Defluviitaleaceae bacterium]|nr:KDGP aldolase family protein [Defluviitaleaceae bacterium]